MRFILVVSFFLSYFISFAQTELPNNFKIGRYVEVFGNDSLKVYFNCTGAIYESTCADYYRIGKMDSTMINVSGDFCDYDMSGHVLLKATIFDNNLEGMANYFYRDGQVSEAGAYKNNIRDGIWIFYYPNRHVQKIYNYIDGEPLVIEAYTSDGKQTVVDGNGEFETHFSTLLQCDKFYASGHITNGVKDGSWLFTDPRFNTIIATEIYDHGKFIKGSSSGRFDNSANKYTKTPRIKFTSFYASEYFNLLDNSMGCPGDNVFLWKYKYQSVDEYFYPHLQKSLNEYKMPSKNQWLVVGLKVSEKNELQEVNVASSINDISLENYVYNLLTQMNKWNAAIVNSQKVESNIFFSILVENNELIIPAYFVRKKK